jgi:hypothetical protein
VPHTLEHHSVGALTEADHDSAVEL